MTEPSTDFPYHEIDGNPEVPESILAKFRRAILFAHDARNSKKSLACMLIAIGDPSAAGVSMRDVARRFKVSKQDISLECRNWCVLLNIQPSSYMRAADRSNFKRNNTRKSK